MTFKDLLAQAMDWLRQDKRISYRALKRQLNEAATRQLPPIPF